LAKLALSPPDLLWREDEFFQLPVLPTGTLHRMLSRPKSIKIGFKERLNKFRKGKCIKALSMAAAWGVSVPGWALSTAHSSMVDLTSRETA